MAVLETPHSAGDADQSARSGLAFGLLCYILWGFLPLLFDLLKDVGSVTIVANRTLCSLLFVGVILIAGRRLGEVKAALSDPRTLRSMIYSALLLAANWLLYVWAVATGQVLEGSFGYFINPLANVAIGMLLLGERQNPWQVASIAVAVVAIGIQAVGVGHIPYVALGLAISFGFYGFFRKTARVGSAGGLFAETLILLPLALGYLCWTLFNGGAAVYTSPYNIGLLLLLGPATSVPLLLFAFAVQRLRLTTIGMLQYISPTIQFTIAIFILHEPINAVQLLSFGLIWVSLAIYSADSVMRRRAMAMG